MHICWTLNLLLVLVNKNKNKIVETDLQSTKKCCAKVGTKFLVRAPFIAMLCHVTSGRVGKSTVFSIYLLLFWLLFTVVVKCFMLPKSLLMCISSSKIKSLAHFMLEILSELFAVTHYCSYEMGCLRSVCCRCMLATWPALHLVGFIPFCVRYLMLI